MKKIIAAVVSLPLAGLPAESPASKFDAAAAERFSRLALACVHKGYPNKISHVLSSAADATRRIGAFSSRPWARPAR